VSGTDRGPGVRFPPPTLFVAGLAVAWLVDTRIRHLAIVNSANAARFLDVVGWVLIALGLLIALWGALTFMRHKTAVYPHSPASLIVVSGPYRFTRNPMYLGFTLAYVGGTLWMNSWWPMLLLPVVMLLLDRFVIQREERYLAAAFGEEYIAYQRRVGRWFG